ncbi:LOW QUALITY PROTEIN: ankyrin repeat and LEM domain-containing protein 1 [Anser cygnoides]|uniref:LOW QUALITY PROTEIN: ankyrin repeat and LEM domain-containing protein 1 n=1 Tax=Anser cygnoides TaxID=8845 RepID=UPI0034D1A08B
MNGAGRREPAGGLRAPSPEELPPLRVAASRGCCWCLEVLLKTGGYPELRDQDGKRAIDLALQRGCRLRVLLLRDSLHVQGWPPAGDKPPLGRCCGCFRGAAAAPLGGPGAEPHPDPAAPWGPRCSLSFLTEGCSEDDRSDGGPLSSTRLSQLGELEPGNSHGSGEPPARLGCPLPSSVPSLPLWSPRGSAFLPQPLASSTLLCAGDEPGQGPLRGTGRWGGPKPSTGARSPPQPLRAGGRDCSSLGDEDSSTTSECFVTAVETLEPSKAGGCQGEAGPQELPPRSPLAVGELPALLQGCTLRGSPPGTPRTPRSPAGLAAGGGSLQPPQFCHVTPRTKSRLQASAERLGASSSSSSLFDTTLEMPRRPPRVRAPRGVPRDTATALGGEDVSSRDGEGTGSLDDTQILPRTPSQPGSPLGGSSSSSTVLLGPGDRDPSQDSPSDPQDSSSSTVLLGPGDRDPPQDSPSDPQDSSSSTVLLGPGDRDPPQDSPSDPQGSSSSSSTVLLGPGDHGSPQDSPSDPQGSPRSSHGAAGPWGPQNPPGLPVRSSGLPPRHQPQGAGAGEPTRATLPHHPQPPRHRGARGWEHEGRVPSEQRSPSTEATSPGDPAVPKGRARTPRVLSDEALRRRLRVLGEDPGPITELTRRVYLRRLEKLSRSPEGHSPELAAALQTGHVPDCAQDERVLAQQFDRPDRSRHWREGLLKASFNYLLLDPRVTQDLPLRCHRLSPAECFRTFVKAVFYVGKGTRARPYCHLSEALSQHRAGTRKGCPKVRRILEIWASGQGVISVHCFQSSVPAEAYTRESCVVEALGLRTITNQRKGNCYGAAASWPPERRRRLGVHMLHRAMRIFLAEGERQLRPADIQAGR